GSGCRCRVRRSAMRARPGAEPSSTLYRADTRVAGLTWEYVCGSSCPPVLVDDPAEDSAAPDRALDRDHSRVVVVGRLLAQALVGAMGVEVVGVLGEHLPRVAFAVEQQPVGALRADAPHEPFRVAVRPGRAGWDLDEVDAFGGEHRIECLGELRVA